MMSMRRYPTRPGFRPIGVTPKPRRGQSPSDHGADLAYGTGMTLRTSTMIRLARACAIGLGAFLVLGGLAGSWWESHWTAAFGGEPDYAGAWTAIVVGATVIVAAVKLRPRRRD